MNKVVACSGFATIHIIHWRITMIRRSVLFCFLLFFYSTVFLANAFALPGASNQNVTAGTVVETMDAGGYTYILVRNSSGDQWVAIPETAVQKGQAIEYYNGMVMKDFTSQKLGRSFSNIIFSNGLVTDSKQLTASANKEPAQPDSFAAAVAKEQQQAQEPEASSLPQLSPGSMGAVVPLNDVSVEKAEGDNAYTVGELFEQAEKLNNSTIRVRGRVVKFNPMIMGRNWIHLQDGTGNPMKNSHDLVVTSKETVKIDDVITMEGKVAAKKDFGAGYRYEVIIEEAKVIR